MLGTLVLLASWPWSWPLERQPHGDELNHPSSPFFYPYGLRDDQRWRQGF